MHRRRTAATLGWVVTLAFVACGQANPPAATGFNDTWIWDSHSWTDRSTQDRPPARRGGTFVFDGARSVAVLFGGEDFDGRMLSDTWTWDGRRWTARSPTRHPAARDGATAVYDPTRRLVWLFGGFSAPSNNGRPTLYHDIWKWDGADWTDAKPASSPAVLSSGLVILAAGRVQSWVGPVMGFDAALGEAVLVTEPPTYEGTETWIWDGAAWIASAGEGGPPPPGYLFYDPSVTSLVFVRDVPRDEAFAAMPPLTYDWFTWDGTGWTVSYPMPQNPNRFGVSGSGSAYDPVDRVLITFGGAAPNSCIDHTSSVAIAETWQWGAGGWSVLDPRASPPARIGPLMVWDSTRSQVVMFGGLSRDACV